MNDEVTRGGRKLEAAGARCGHAPRVRGGDAHPTGQAGTEWFAAATPGLEDALAVEAARLPGATQVRAVPGGVEFRGKLETGMAANLHLRIASRVVLRLGQVKARDFAPLRRKLAELPWELFLPKDRPMRVDVSASRCRLYHSKALAESVELAVGDCLGPLPALPARPEGCRDDDDAGEFSRVLMRGEHDRFTISVDSSGALLHRRGWRIESGRAPLRETLAAGILALCEYDPSLPFFDPMCGSGTIALEACAIALGRAPGLHRTFAFEKWPCLPAQAWASLRARAQPAEVAAPPALILSADRDPAAAAIARRNAERAGFAAHLQFQVAAFGSAPPPAPRGLMVINPPYGRRLSDRGQVARLGRDIGRILHSQYPGWRVGVLGLDAGFAQALKAGLRRPVKATHALRNGGLRVTLLVFESVKRPLAG